MENSMEDPDKTKNRTTVWSTNPTPGHIPRDNSNLKRCVPPIYITALFTTAEIRKQPKYPSTDEWMKKIRYICIMEYYSTIKKNEIMSTAATWMDLEIIILNEVSQRMTNIVWHHICVESKIWQKWTHLWNRNGLADTENTHSYQRGKGMGEG